MAEPAHGGRWVGAAVPAGDVLAAALVGTVADTRVDAELAVGGLTGAVVTVGVGADPDRGTDGDPGTDLGMDMDRDAATDLGMDIGMDAEVAVAGPVGEPAVEESWDLLAPVQAVSTTITAPVAMTHVAAVHAAACPVGGIS
jgi:hypothetical protein